MSDMFYFLIGDSRLPLFWWPVHEEIHQMRWTQNWGTAIIAAISLKKKQNSDNLHAQLNWRHFCNNDNNKNNYYLKIILNGKWLFSHQSMIFLFAISILLSPPRKDSQAEAAKPTKQAIWCHVYSGRSLLGNSNNCHKCNYWAGWSYKGHQHKR